MEKDLVSIIVPVYNVAPYLKRCINSICKQSYKNIEIILVNDGSTDDSKTICEEYSREDFRIRLINKENGGLSDARNKALDVMSGEYVICIDSDDWVSNNHVEILVKTIKKYCADIVISSFSTCRTNENLFRQPTTQKLYLMNGREALCESLYAKDFTGSAWGKIYKTSLFRDIRYPKGKLFEDIFTTYKLFEKSNRVVYINANTYSYFEREGSITKTNITDKHMVIFEAIREIRECYKNDPAVCRATAHQYMLSSYGILGGLKFNQKEYIHKINNIIINNRKVVIQDYKAQKKIKLFSLLSYCGIIPTFIILKLYIGIFKK